MAAASEPRIIVVGTGIGGLVSALALRRAGLDAVLFERAPELRRVQVGAGILLEQNAMKAFQHIGLGEQVRAIGAPVHEMAFKTWRGGPLASWDVEGLSQQVSAPAIAVARAALHRVLADELGEAAVRLDAECTGFEQDATGVTVRFKDGREERGDLLVGADGVRSVVRGQLHGATKPRYAGYTVWQGIAEYPPGGDYPYGLMRVLWGRGVRFVSYYVAPGRLFWFVVGNAPEGQTDDNGTRRATLNRLLKGWLAPTEAILAATPDTQMVRTDNYDREPLERWGEGRVTLLGDAAHPITINLGQGAAQAIEDAVVLSKCLAGAADPVAALRRYEEKRIPRTAEMMTKSRRMGNLGRVANPVACVARNQLLKVILNKVAWKEHVKDMEYQF